jgi:hypothetical protein
MHSPKLRMQSPAPPLLPEVVALLDAAAAGSVAKPLVRAAKAAVRAAAVALTEGDEDYPARRLLFTQDNFLQHGLLPPENVARMIDWRKEDITIRAVFRGVIPGHPGRCVIMLVKPSLGPEGDMDHDVYLESAGSVRRHSTLDSLQTDPAFVILGPYIAQCAFSISETRWVGMSALAARCPRVAAMEALLTGVYAATRLDSPQAVCTEMRRVLLAAAASGALYDPIKPAWRDRDSVASFGVLDIHGAWVVMREAGVKPNALLRLTQSHFVDPPVLATALLAGGNAALRVWDTSIHMFRYGEPLWLASHDADLDVTTDIVNVRRAWPPLAVAEALMGSARAAWAAAAPEFAMKSAQVADPCEDPRAGR